MCALRRENSVGSTQPPVPQPRACISSGRASKNRLAQRTPRERRGSDAVDLTWKRNGGEHAWSFLRISRVFDTSSTKRRGPGCIGCEQSTAKRDGRSKNASTGTGLSDVDISHDQSSRWQKFAAVPQETFEPDALGKIQNCRRLMNFRSVRVAPECGHRQRRRARTPHPLERWPPAAKPNG